MTTRDPATVYVVLDDAFRRPVGVELTAKEAGLTTVAHTQTKHHAHVFLPYDRRDEAERAHLEVAAAFYRDMLEQVETEFLNPSHIAWLAAERKRRGGA